MTDNPTTDAVMAAVEKFRDLSLMSELGSYYRLAFAHVDAELTRLRARVETLTEENHDLAKGVELYRDDFHRVRVERDEARADLAALVPLARWVVAPDPAAPTSSEQYAAARAALASVEARQ